jgi:hypothetical protein
VASTFCGISPDASHELLQARANALCPMGLKHKLDAQIRNFHAVENFFHAVEKSAKKFPCRGSSGFFFERKGVSL